MKRTLQISAVIVVCMLFGAIGGVIRDAAYSTWGSLPPVRRAEFNHRVGQAMAANPGALGNGGGAIQGVATSTGCTDVGAGLCLDTATGTLVGVAATQLEPLTFAGASYGMTQTGSAPQMDCNLSSGCEWDFNNTTPP